ncbi:MAG: carboxylating nicotinate-nucleotide diphosphorylase, partial [Armatimonadetes bacterium]|nr:carboxylating nicotinate-nucleotide diphosphorylase [Armatimonadota bacterium]
TSRAVIPPETPAIGRMLAKESGVVAGMAVALECFRQLSSQTEFTAVKHSGECFEVGEVLATVQGPARALLAAERTALNFLQRLCGIATLTRKFVDAVAGTGVEIADTRKTDPGIRSLDRAAVRAGGGKNHRYALYDGILIKDNHIRLVGSVSAAVQAARSKAHSLFKVEIETTNLDQVREALAAGSDIIMLDNMNLEMMGEAVQIIGDRALVEASGGIELDEVAEVAAIGVDIISVGTLTHSAPSLDISLELSPIE